MNEDIERNMKLYGLPTCPIRRVSSRSVWVMHKGGPYGCLVTELRPKVFRIVSEPKRLLELLVKESRLEG